MLIMYDNLRSAAEQMGHHILVSGYQGLGAATALLHAIGNKASMGVTSTLYSLGLDETRTKEFIQILRDDISAGKEYMDIKPYVKPSFISSSLALFWKQALIDGRDANATFNSNLFVSLNLENRLAAKSYTYYFKFCETKSVRCTLNLSKRLQENAVSNALRNNTVVSKKGDDDRVPKWNRRVDEQELFGKIGSPRKWKLGSDDDVYSTPSNNFGSSVDPVLVRKIESPHSRDITGHNTFLPVEAEKKFLPPDDKSKCCCHSNKYKQPTPSPWEEVMSALDTIKQTNVCNQAIHVNVVKDKSINKLVNNIKPSYKAKEKKKSGVFKPITKFFNHAKYVVSNSGKQDIDIDTEVVNQHIDGGGDEIRNNACKAVGMSTDDTEMGEHNSADVPMPNESDEKTDVSVPNESHAKPETRKDYGDDTSGTLVLQIPANIRKIVLEKDGRRITVEI